MGSFSALRPPVKTNTKKEENTMSQLNVVLHGLISLSFERAQNKVRALLIDMPEHTVAAGYWLAETSIPKGALLELTNVTGGTPNSAPFDSSKNILAASPAQIDRPKWNAYRYAEILFPWPSAIYSLNQKEIGPILTGQTKTGATAISENQVFVYSVADGTFAKLEGISSTPWNGYVFMSIDLGDNNIHILNEPEVNPTDGHVLEEFRKSAEIFKSNLRLTQAILPGNRSPVPPQLAGRIADVELLPLASRQDIAQRIGTAVRTKAVFQPPPGNPVGGPMVCAGASRDE
jgi:hypothetical protein